MMKKYFTSFVMLVCFLTSFAQHPSFKPVIDSAAIVTWADLNRSQPSITSDGKYFMYSIHNLPAGSKTLVIQSTENEWKKEFVGADMGIFSSDNKLVLFQAKDSLCFLHAGSNKMDIVPGIVSFKVPVNDFSNNPTDVTRVAYCQKNDRKVILRSLSTSKEVSFDNVVDYAFNENGSTLLIKKQQPNNGSESIELVSTHTGEGKTVWSTQWFEGKKLSSRSYSFDKEGKQLVFVVEDKTHDSEPQNSVWYYREGMPKAIEKVNNKTPGIDSGMLLSRGVPSFSKNGKYIFFTIEPKPEPTRKPDPNAVQVDVWNYKDLVKQNIQLNYLKNSDAHLIEPTKQLVSTIAVDGSQAFCLQKSGGKSFVLTDSPNDMVIAANQTFRGDKDWLEGPTNYYLVSLKDGKSTLLISGNYDDFSFSNDGKCLVYFDYAKAALFSYEFETGKTTEISSGISEPITQEADKGSRFTTPMVGFAGWLGERAVIIYDNYDIWKIDVTGKIAPVNLTKGYGKSHHIKFRILNSANSPSTATYLKKMPLMLSAFDVQNKNNGFFSLDLNGNLSQLSMAPCLYVATDGQTSISLAGIEPVKALNKDVWIVRRQTATDAPNFFVTKNFKDFKQLTNLQPQKRYNWLTSEMISWRQFDGDSSLGILYKPENFDPTKKYPVIVYYYEKRSDQLNEFLKPDFTGGGINIPYFVSRGYLIFVPDIHYTVPKPGESIVNSVVSGVEQLCKLGYIDSTKIGLQGQSFGGYETNYLITHSNKFAAAVESAGATNLISEYGTLLPDGSINESNKNIHLEKDGQFRIQATLWQNRDAYINNSPIFNADKVTTALLIRHNKKDELVPWGQGVELFTALRRLNKKAWMLQYDNGGHLITLKKDKIDCTKRILQFFDHYLKEAPAPKWMTEGIPAKLKGIETGYELDPAGSCGEDCKVCKMWNEKMKKDSVGTMKEIQDSAKREHWLGNGQ